MGVLCIQRTLASGAAAGVATGLGAATVHLVYSALAVIGIGAIARPWLEANASAVAFASGLILLWFALRLYRRTVVLEHAAADGLGLPRAYVSAIVLGAANPLTIVLFLAMLHALTGQSGAPLLVAGVFAGSVLWWLVLSAVVAVVRLRLNVRLLAMSGKLAGAVLMMLGVVTIVKTAARWLWTQPLI